MKKWVTAEDLQENLLAVLDEVATSHEAIVVTKDGRVVAELVPKREVTLEEMRRRLKIQGDIVSPIEGSEPLRGSVLFEGDIVSPVDEQWEADRE